MGERCQPAAEGFAALVPVAVWGAAGHTTRPPSVRRHAPYYAPVRGLQPLLPPCMAGRVTVTYEMYSTAQYVGAHCILYSRLRSFLQYFAGLPVGSLAAIRCLAVSLCQSVPVPALPPLSPLLPDVTPTWRADGPHAWTPRTPLALSPRAPSLARVVCVWLSRAAGRGPRHATPRHPHPQPPRGRGASQGSPAQNCNWRHVTLHWYVWRQQHCTM